MLRSFYCSRQRALALVEQLFLPGHGQDEVAFLVFEFQDDMNVGEFVRHTELDGSSGIEKIHGLDAVVRPGTNVFEVKTRLFVLKKYSHTRKLQRIDRLMLPTCG